MQIHILYTIELDIGKSEKDEYTTKSEISSNLIIITCDGLSHDTWFSYFFINI